MIDMNSEAKTRASNILADARSMSPIVTKTETTWIQGLEGIAS